MHRPFCIFIIYLLLINSIPAYAQEDPQAPYPDEEAPVFVTPEGNVFFPKTQEQEQRLNKLMQFYEEGNTNGAEFLEEQLLKDPDFESKAHQALN